MIIILFIIYLVLQNKKSETVKVIEYKKYQI